MLLAVRSLSGQYYLNGNDNIEIYAEPIEIGGILFEYQRHNAGIEYLSAIGPLLEPLVFEV